MNFTPFHWGPNNATGICKKSWCTLCFAYMDVGEEREQDAGSFAYMDVGEGREQDAGSFAYKDVGEGREQDAGSFAYKDVGEGREQNAGNLVVPVKGTRLSLLLNCCGMNNLRQGPV